jgi:hypothetical protein
MKNRRGLARQARRVVSSPAAELAQTRRGQRRSGPMVSPRATCDTTTPSASAWSRLRCGNGCLSTSMRGRAAQPTLAQGHAAKAWYRLLAAQQQEEYHDGDRPAEEHGARRDEGWPLECGELLWVKHNANVVIGKSTGAGIVLAWRSPTATTIPFSPRPRRRGIHRAALPVRSLAPVRGADRRWQPGRSGRPARSCRLTRGC